MSTRLYEEQRARELALYVTKAARVVREVGERWIELHGLVPAGSGGSATARPARRTLGRGCRSGWT